MELQLVSYYTHTLFVDPIPDTIPFKVIQSPACNNPVTVDLFVTKVDLQDVITLSSDFDSILIRSNNLSLSGQQTKATVSVIEPLSNISTSNKVQIKFIEDFCLNTEAVSYPMPETLL